MTERVFTVPDAWTGGSYDLALELGPRDDARLSRALNALWTHPDIEGCYLHCDREPNEQLSVDASSEDARVYGVARIGARTAIAIQTVILRLDDGADWIHVCLPIGSLGRIFDVGAFPFGDGGALAWRPTLDDWLIELGRRVFEALPFQLALIGWDGGDLEDAIRVGASGVPHERWVGYLVPSDDILKWFAPNRNAPLTFRAAL